MRSYSSAPRGFIIFAQIFGTIFSVIGLIIYSYFMDTLIDNAGGDPQSISIYSFVLAVIVYFTWKALYTCIIIINAMSKMSDEELIANKWIISSLSLTLGGFFTPYIMNAFPNINVRSTISPKVFLSRTLGVTMLFGGIVFMISYGVYMRDYLSYDSTNSMTMFVFIAGGIITFIGLLATTLFFLPNATDKFKQSNALSVFMHFVSGIILVIVTLELVYVIVLAFLELLRAVYNFMYYLQDNIFVAILSLFNLIITFVYVGFIWYITGQTMVGIWKDEVDFSTYEAVERQRQSQTR